MARMPSTSTVKLIVYEVLQFAFLCVPIFVVLERFASLMRAVRSADTTAYWLVVAVSIAYVTTVTLFVWAPLKFFILKSRRFFTDITNWRPVTLAYVLLSTLPCFAILLASSKVQVDTGNFFDVFTELPVSLVLFALICVDIVERIRPYRLRGQADGLDSDFELSGPVLTHLEQVSSVSAQLPQVNGGENGAAVSPEVRSMSASGRWRAMDGYNMSRTSSTAYLYSSRSHSGSPRIFWARDPRHELFLDTFLFWLDTVEMVRVGGVREVFYSAWIFPVYILAFISTLRVVVAPNSPLLASLGVLSQDLPFLVVRISLVVVFGYVTPLLYVMKNLLVCLTFVYFMLLTKLKVFSRGSMF
ncbi:transmembrane protein 236-like [Astyanax mexicanus]|uniref:Transmembrane protein 236 n=1 Tax=Astyanax mexicanus TaxID=7994 RepID=A0A8B9JN10_ASTMX|nr:transmembrane protein 236-like [Astyanax mexicanus]